MLSDAAGFLQLRPLSLREFACQLCIPLLCAFRYSALCLAKELQLTGWVKNLTDGRVEAELQGQAELVDSFVERISQRGRIVVEFVEEEDRELCYEEGFEVR